MKYPEASIVFLSFAMFWLLAGGFASAQVRLQYYGIDDVINDDFTVLHKITLQFSEPIDNLNYQLDFPIYNLTAESSFKSDCAVSTKNSQSLISCDFMGMTQEDNTIVLGFMTQGPIKGNDASKRFSVNYGVGLPVDRIFTIIRLPEKSILTTLVPNESFSPSNGEILTDGRRIMVYWNMKNLSAGGSLPFSVDYAFSRPEQGLPSNVLALALLAVVVIGVIAAGIYLRREHASESITTILNEDERKIVDILSKHDGKTLQKQIVRESDFSKAKVSRLVRNLRERNVITIEPVSGRENRIVLKLKWIPAEKGQQQG